MRPSKNCVHIHASRLHLISPSTHAPLHLHSYTHHITRRLVLHPYIFLHTTILASLHDTTTFHDKTGALRVPYYFFPCTLDQTPFHDIQQTPPIFASTFLFIYSSHYFASDLNRDDNRTYYHHCTTRYACPFPLVLKMLSRCFSSRFLITNCYEYSCTMYMIRPCTTCVRLPTLPVVPCYEYIKIWPLSHTNADVAARSISVGTTRNGRMDERSEPTAVHNQIARETMCIWAPAFLHFNHGRQGPGEAGGQVE